MNFIKKINFKLLTFILLSLLFSINVNAQKRNSTFILVLDAGHGGHDSGARGVVDLEKNIALDVTLKVGKLVKDYFKDDIKIIYTRKDDTFIPLHERANIANRNHADFFLSIHCNSARPGAYGTETFALGSDPKRANSNLSIVKKENSVILLEDDHKEKYEDFDPSSPESLIGLTLMQNTHLENSLIMAKAIEDNYINKDKRLSRGVKQAGFLVLWRTAMPSVLTEIGFVTNPEEGRYLASEEGKNKTAESIFNAIKYYKKRWDLIRGYNNNYEPQKNEVKELAEPEKPVAGKVFKIQFLVSKRSFRKGAPQLKGLDNVEVVKTGDLYKYFYGSTSFESKRDANLRKVKARGFPDAIIAEFPTGDNQNNIYFDNDKNKTDIYRIQILSSQSNLNENSPLFKGLNNISKVKEGNLFKYLYGNFDNEENAKNELEKIRKAKFPDAFVVLFKNGNKIIIQ
ncbi:N-acetylmuramoyl-L-alanine amidase [Weeksellaceae bacterium TAE3-ERU29]|nr:N-acetylmuramoyl-L-alanine amidase [Weeksellaceae bacterium TAE3-ERU29]